MLRIATLVLLLMTSLAARGQETPQLHEKLKALDFDFGGPFVKLDDGGILCVKGNSAHISRDEGKTWESHPIFDEGKFKVRPEYALIGGIPVRSSKGTIVLLFIDDLVKNWKWDQATNTTVSEPYLYVWSTRSHDNGKTWEAPKKVQDGYCGAIRDLIVTREGALVSPLQKYLPEHSRHATLPVISTDDGQTWQSAGVLDIGGRGHHDGSIEATVTELKDGRLWMLLRTTHDYLYQSFSTDGGKSWGEMTPTQFDASSSPAIIKRLESGRLMIAWNRLKGENDEKISRRGGQHAAKEASWFRLELAGAFSDDDGKTWTKPVVLAKVGKGRVSYPFIFEPRPGVIWLTTMQGGLRAELNEADFVAVKQ